MHQESKDLIITNFVTLMKKCNVDVLVPLMLNKGVFNDKELKEIFSTNDARQNKRVFFFNMQKKDQAAFSIFIESLIDTNQRPIAQLFMRQRTGASVFKNAVYNDVPEGTKNLDLQNLNLHIDPSTTPLNVQVKASDQFFDTSEHNRDLEFYSSRSINRGRAIMINNYKFNLQHHPYRNGAEVDSKNLEELFNQMGGWEFVKYENKTAREMREILDNFRDYPHNTDYDAFFIIIMSHGTENTNDTVIFGIDEGQLDASDIQDIFSNENCQSMRGKPKVFILPMCRGARTDIPTINVVNTQSSTQHDSIPNKSRTGGTLTLRKRSTEDMLVGYSTLQGFKAHRDTNRGSWYIEFLCEVFMKHAFNTSVDELLMMIDQRLRKRTSEDLGMQTAEHRNKGFKKLYLHPGIYFQGNAVKKFYERD